MKRIRTSMLVIVIVLLLPAAFAGAAVADHVYEIRMDQQWDYEYPPDPIEYVFTAEVFCDATIEGISFLSPNGSVFNLLKYEFDEENDRWEWIYEGEHATADELSLYGDGDYIFTINYAGGGYDETSVPFSTPSGDPIPQPTQEPVPTYPLHGMTGVPTEVTFGWNLCEDDNANSISIGYFPVVGPGLLGETLFDCSHTSYGPVSLTPGKLYELELFFAHACSGTTTDGIPYSLEKFAASDHQFTTIPEAAVEAIVDLDPDTLNLKSKAKWIKCYIRLPEGYDVADIDPESILFNGEVAPDRCRVHKAKQMMIVRFYRSEVQAIVEPGEVELTVSGELTDGTKFEGADTITVIDKGGKK